MLLQANILVAIIPFDQLPETKSQVIVTYVCLWGLHFRIWEDFIFKIEAYCCLTAKVNTSAIELRRTVRLQTDELKRRLSLS